jgi:hypothetical protein
MSGLGALGELVSVEDLASRAKWPYRRMLRLLSKVNEECHGLLLINIASKGKRPRYVVSLEKVRSHIPQWAEQVESLSGRCEELGDRMEDVAALVREAHRCIGELRSMGRAIESRVSRLEKGRA